MVADGIIGGLRWNAEAVFLKSFKIFLNAQVSQCVVLFYFLEILESKLNCVVEVRKCCFFIFYQ